MTKRSFKMTKRKSEIEDQIVNKNPKQTSKTESKTWGTLTETFNQHKLNYILNNTTFMKELNNLQGDDGIDYLKITKEYLAKSRCGTIEVEYSQTKKIENFVGRKFAKGSLSMQTISRKIRHSIADNKHLDLDLKNAGCKIVECMMDKMGVNVPWLEDFNNNRELKLSELEVSRDVAKKAISSLLSGGKRDYRNIKNKPQWLEDLEYEISCIHDHLEKTHADFEAFRKEKLLEKTQNNDYNIQGKFLNFLIIKMEDDILMSVYKFLKEPKNCVLCFDGLQVLASEYDSNQDYINGGV